MGAPLAAERDGWPGSGVSGAPRMRMKRNRATLIVVVLVYLAAGGAWWWYRANAPLDEADFSTITGTLVSAEEKSSGGSPYLEFRIHEHSARFRVPADGYDELFHRREFFLNASLGTEIRITARTAELENPRRPIFDPVDTVFVYGLRDEKMAYCSLAGRKFWEEDNRFYGWIVALVLSVAAVGLTVLYSTAAPEASSGDALEEPRDGGQAR